MPSINSSIVLSFLHRDLPNVNIRDSTIVMTQCFLPVVTQVNQKSKMSGHFIALIIT